MTQNMHSRVIDKTNIDKHHPEDDPGSEPYRQFLRTKVKHGVSNNSIRKYSYDLRRFREWFAAEYPELTLSDVKPDAENPDDTGTEVADDFLSYLRDDAGPQGDGLAASTRKNNIITVKEFWEQLKNKGHTDAENPWLDVYKTAKNEDKRESSNYAREMSLSDLAEFIRGIKEPRMHAMAMTQFKGFMRRGTLINLDLRCFNIDDPDVERYYDHLGIELHPKVEDHPDAFFIESEPDMGEVHAGEVRHAGSKPVGGRLMHIDDELKAALKRWLAMRPVTSNSRAMFVSMETYQGERMHPDTYGDKFKEYATEAGYYDVMNSLEDNVTSHYLRHAATTYFRTETPLKGFYIDAFRGDSTANEGDGGSKDVYTHLWFESKGRPAYKEHVPKLY